MKSIGDITREKPWLGAGILAMVLSAGVLLGLFLTTIAERRTEERFANTVTREINEFEPRNEEWGKHYPREFQTYYQTADTTFASKHGGAARRDMLEEFPDLVMLWAGYPFSKNYNQARGHYYAIEDVHNILRTAAPMTPDEGPMTATCWTCKGPDVPRLMAQVGPADFYNKTWAYWGPEIVNPIGCADCHDAKTMALRITRPALAEAFQRQGKDITQATHQEMRSLVCAQCHVEYYFQPGSNYLTFPWDRGMNVDSMEAYYDDLAFADWTHQLSRAPMIKAQHPDYELYTTGIHAQRGVSCADCHMPYRSEGGMKFTDHHIQSPLNHIDKACQVCHRESEDELRRSVYDRQDKLAESRQALEGLLVKSHFEAKAAWDAGATEEQMQPVLKQIRSAQWRWDFAAAGHGSSFHAPVEMGRIIAKGTQQAQEARVLLARTLAKLGITEPVAIPEYKDKASAQAILGMDMAQLQTDKQRFRTEIVPQWLQQAKEREAKY